VIQRGNVMMSTDREVTQGRGKGGDDVVGLT
jgi:hypothetical protein